MRKDFSWGPVSEKAAYGREVAFIPELRKTQGHPQVSVQEEQRMCAHVLMPKFQGTLAPDNLDWTRWSSS